MNRAGLENLVLSTVEQYPTVALRGSFFFRDFHWDEDRQLTLSDIDLVSRTSTLEPDVANQISLALQKSVGLRLKVSVHPTRNFETLSAEDLRFLALGEYLRVFRQDIDDYTRSFYRAKIGLMVLRVHPSERYQDVADRLRTEVAAKAASVKRYGSQYFGVADLLALVASVDLNEAQQLGEMVSAPSIAQGQKYRQSLLVRASIDPWHRDYLAKFLES